MSRLVQTTHLPGASKRLFGIPGFRLYALANHGARYPAPWLAREAAGYTDYDRGSGQRAPRKHASINAFVHPRVLFRSKLGYYIYIGYMAGPDMALADN